MLFVLGLVLVCCSQLILLWIRSFKRKNFPPGPISFPILGHLPLLGLQTAHINLARWRKKYGPILGIWFGSYKSIVLSDAKLARQALNMKEFSGRPNFYVFNSKSNSEPKGLTLTEGRAWKEQRSFALRELRNFGMGRRSMESIIQEEIRIFLKDLERKEGMVIQGKSLTNVATLNSLWKILIGGRLTEDDPEIFQALDKIANAVENPKVLMCLGLPWLSKIAPKWSGYERVATESQLLLKFVRDRIEKRRWDYVEGEPGTFVHAFYDEVGKTTDPHSSFHPSQDVLVHVILDLFAAGSETSGLVMSWMCLYLIYFPDIQKKLQNEIDAVLGGDCPSLSHRSSMPFANAFLDEVLRFCSLAPLGFFRKALEDVSFEDYLIPKDTWLIINVYSINFDGAVWGDPEIFRPERFIDEEGRYRKNDNLLSFSSGKRICLGESLAMDQLFLFATSLCQKFTLCPANQKKITLKPMVGLGLSVQPFEMTVQIRR